MSPFLKFVLHEKRPFFQQMLILDAGMLIACWAAYRLFGLPLMDGYENPWVYLCQTIGYIGDARVTLIGWMTVATLVIALPPLLWFARRDYMNACAAGEFDEEDE